MTDEDFCHTDSLSWVCIRDSSEVTEAATTAHRHGRARTPPGLWRAEPQGCPAKAARGCPRPCRRPPVTAGAVLSRCSCPARTVGRFRRYRHMGPPHLSVPALATATGLGWVRCFWRGARSCQAARHVACRRGRSRWFGSGPGTWRTCSASAARPPGPSDESAYRAKGRRARGQRRMAAARHGRMAAARLQKRTLRHTTQASALVSFGSAAAMAQTRRRPVQACSGLAPGPWWRANRPRTQGVES
jgi:hypothetical protein